MKNLKIYMPLVDGSRLDLEYTTGKEMIGAMISDDIGPPPRGLVFEGITEDRKKVLLSVPFSDSGDAFVAVEEILGRNGTKRLGDDFAKKMVIECLNKLYAQDQELFDMKAREECLTFRFAHYLQNLLKDFLVDCEFDKSWGVDGERRDGKQIRNGRRVENKLVDIIVHDRGQVNYFCIEIKRWGNENKKKDRNNLSRLTESGKYGYKYKLGFRLNLGQGREQTRWEIFKNGQLHQKEEVVPTS
ncbi:MAG TPA: hypothetical protein VMU88_01405 [bacterium]|nr:hypothetical protein [bacterium]